MPKVKYTKAIFGGSFNPIHHAHLNIAKHIYENEIANEVVFIPTKNPPHKFNENLASFGDRIEMIRLAVSDINYCSYSDYEAQIPEINYTINTLHAFSLVYPTDEIKLVIGMDNLLQFKTWYKYQEILDLYDLIVFTRSGFNRPDIAALENLFGSFFAEKIDKAIIDDFDYDISASVIRNNIKNNNTFDKLPSSVLNYINEKQLY